jgi:phage shock protein PspC (stress-responsive transcriptional regulator)
MYRPAGKATLSTVSEISVEHTVRDFWATRPHRRASDKKIAGVAAAIGRRYAIDPILVRVAFVVATFSGGAGVLLYLLGWLFLPEEGDTASGAEKVAGRGRSSMSAALTVLLVVLLIPAGAIVLDSHGSGIIGLAACLGALLLLHRSRGSLGEIPGSPPPARPRPDTAAGTTAPTSEPATPGTHAAEDPERPIPPAWDPLGAAPFAWDLPEPSAQPTPTTPPRSARSKITPITLGLALLTGGLALAFGPALSVAQIAAMVLGVIGLGLIVGSFLQSGRGLIPIAIPLALLTWVLSTAPVYDFRLGNSNWDAPVSADELQPRYSVTLGNAYLDLRKLQLTSDQKVPTSVTVGMGETHILLPQNLNVELSCQTQLGEVHCLGHNDSGGFPSRVTVTEPAPGGSSGTLVLDVRAIAGQVHVDRAS